MAGDVPLTEWAEKALTGRHVSPRYRPYIEELLRALAAHLSECDRRIEESMPNWRLERLAAVDRNILRIGVVEMLAVDDVPDTVAIHEAIRLAEKYGSGESPGFINGVLDAVSRGAAARP